MREGPSFQTTMSTLKQIEGNRPAKSAQRDMSFTSLPYCNSRRAQNPNQPRLLSPSCNSWHRSMEPDDKKSAITHVVFTRAARRKGGPPSIRQESSSAIMRNPTKAHAFTASTGMLGPNRTSSLRTIGSFFKRKKESSPYGPYLPWDIPLRTGCAQPHTVPSIQKRPQDLFHPIAGHCLEPTLTLIFHAL